ncbi:uncharacterized protein EV420DRAFT_790634 [Desarmillaria tabescens]|uniref:C2H2-type domain-containing protein n=1 Tax=Armillaria tabescens TaxID=1929756 RepID=A0AA39JV11_ARMTA|nr:uncharacterized protein EV420DRAFT_790634 [Desarmillaria tabescens]KAK0449067.1 hypothetical protein EV420DRAFT_790634 [Desarmillaria tabescens]
MPKGKKYYPCGECSDVLSREHDLERHRLAKHAPEEEKILAYYYCRCGARSIQKTNIVGHIRSAHTGETVDCGLCEYKSFSDASLTRHRKDEGHYLERRRRKPKAKTPIASSSSSPAPEIHSVADFVKLYGDVPLTYTEYSLYESLVSKAKKQAPPTPPCTPSTSTPASLPAAPASATSTPATPVLSPLVSAALVPEVLSPPVDRAATPTPSPECFLSVPEAWRLPPIDVNRRDCYPACPLTAPVLQPRLSPYPSRYHRYGPY